MNSTNLFGGWMGGWIARFPYLLCLVIYIVLGLALGYATMKIYAIPPDGFIDQTAGYKALAACAGFLWAGLFANLVAKRFRDSGLPGWAMTAIMLTISVVILYVMRGSEPIFGSESLLGMQPEIEGQAFRDLLTIEVATLEGGVASIGFFLIAAVLAAIPPTDVFPWVCDRDRWSTFD